MTEIWFLIFGASCYWVGRKDGMRYVAKKLLQTERKAAQ